jgi:hypothetical protein
MALHIGCYTLRIRLIAPNVIVGAACVACAASTSPYHAPSSRVAIDCLLMTSCCYAAQSILLQQVMQGYSDSDSDDEAEGTTTAAGAAAGGAAAANGEGTGAAAAAADDDASDDSEVEAEANEQEEEDDTDED